MSSPNRTTESFAFKTFVPIRDAFHSPTGPLAPMSNVNRLNKRRKLCCFFSSFESTSMVCHVHDMAKGHKRVNSSGEIQSHHNETEHYIKASQWQTGDLSVSIHSQIRCHWTKKDKKEWGKCENYIRSDKTAKREEVVSVWDFGSHSPKKQLKKETIILCNSMETAAHIYSLLLCVLRSWRRHRASVRREEITFQAINKFFLTFPLSTPLILRLSSFWLLSHWDVFIVVRSQHKNAGFPFVRSNCFCGLLLLHFSSAKFLSLLPINISTDFQRKKRAHVCVSS